MGRVVVAGPCDSRWHSSVGVDDEEATQRATRQPDAMIGSSCRKLVTYICINCRGVGCFPNGPKPSLAFSLHRSQKSLIACKVLLPQTMHGRASKESIQWLSERRAQLDQLIERS